MQENQMIDFVIPWVDGSDPAWQKERDAKAAQLGSMERCDNRSERYRDWDNLRYWFRGVEKFAPWVHKIYFVTWGHLPEWLDVRHPKLVIVRHEDYIPKEYLPTFNSHTIEWNLHRIHGLSENFVYFNDDFFLLREMKPSDFFVDGKPKDMLALQPVVTNVSDPVMPYIYLNNSMVLTKYFDKRKNMKAQPGAYWHVGYPFLYFGYNLLETVFPRFTGFYTVHGPSPLKKETYRVLWEKEEELLDQTCTHPFRNAKDVSQYLLREWQKLSGNFVPANVAKLCRYFDVDDQNRALIDTIEKRKAKCVCINEANVPFDFEQAKKQINQALETILPKKSAFEL